MPATAARSTRKSRGGAGAAGGGSGGGGSGSSAGNSSNPAENGVREDKENPAPAKSEQSKKPSKKRKINNDDGFEFRVRKSTRLSQRVTEQVAAPEPEPAPAAAKPPKPPAKSKTTTKTAASTSKPAPAPAEPPAPEPAAEEAPAAPPKEKRKKKVLVRVKRPRPAATSEDGGEAKPKAKRKIPPNKDKLPVVPAKPREPTPPPAQPATPPPAPPPAQTQPTKTGEPSVAKIQLPTSDTPINRKNAKYRKTGGGARRSSVTMRGRRASSMMSEGIVVKPHPELDAKEFYKHINQEQLEHMRMRQLLSWCGHRALESEDMLSKKQPVPRGSDANVQNIARVIKEEVFKEITSNGKLSSWYDRPAVVEPEKPKKPNPRNTENLKKLETLQTQLASLDAEIAAWNSLAALTPAAPLSLPRAPLSLPSLLPPEDVALTEKLLPESQEQILAARKTVKQFAGDIEFQMDRLADGVHRMQTYAEEAEELAGEVMERVVGEMEREREVVRGREGTGGLPLVEVLRSLAR